MNSTDTVYLNGTNSGKISLNVPSNTTAFGIASSSLIVYLSDYNSVFTPPITFSTTILGSIPPPNIGG